ncbi:MAG: DEAD/DEAH box helicase family protein [Candidatus Nomurabacteria bacterium]|jgi:type III restriction enzyme|nr:DEAD/DEAH box helicase family protein [Candidatus Nomurabacteria bacterium]
MKLQFETNLDYQLEAIRAAVDIFEGQSYMDGAQVELNTGERQVTIEQASAVKNVLNVDNGQIAENVRKIQERNSILDSPIKSANDARAASWGKFGRPWSSVGQANIKRSNKPLDGMNFTIEMETGTGKTYVYLRTIRELRKKYGWRKFIIVVPSVAIKEGVLKNLEVTKEHFASLYDRQEMDYYVWDAKKRGQARQFATSDALQIMVITIDSFAKAENIMNKASDYGTPLHFIQATNPIVIIDEPQNMETDKRRAAIESLNPLCTLRYSATHKNLYNLMYSLNPVDAYDKGLVKKIEVDSVVAEEAYNNAYVNFIKFGWKNKSTPVAEVEIDADDKVGLQRRVLKLESGNDLFELSGRRAVYDGYVLDRVNVSDGYIEFSNGKTFYIGQRDESLRDDILRYQIERTVENHFEKELKLAGQGIKVLSLFFIDRVANYREYTDGGFKKGKFAVWFEEAFAKMRAKPRFAEVLKDFSAEEVHNGYFAADKKGVWKDSRDGEDGGKTKDDDGAYELIMKDKERLLDVKEPLRFIFSHSALREGWDNPNVFNICTLNETSSEMKKRQEIGRGLRLPVNADGERVRDENVNILTVVANESYEDFSRKLQTEIETETGVEFGGRIKKKADRKRVRLTKKLELDESFRELWDRIKYKTRYHVEFADADLVSETVKMLSEVIITKPRITSTTTRITEMSGGMTSEVRNQDRYKDGQEIPAIIPDLLSKIAERTKATRKVIFEILDRSELFDKILQNPQQVIDEVSEKIGQAMQRLMIDNIKYEKTGEAWDMRLFENKELDAYIYDAAAKSGAVEVGEGAKTVYDFVDVDSEVEHDYLRALEANERIKFYVKSPGWFKIDTPLGKYNPDWAVVFDGDERVYFVAETKGTENIEELRPDEQGKIRAGRKHFSELDVPYIAPTISLNGTLKKINERSLS